MSTQVRYGSLIALGTHNKEWRATVISDGSQPFGRYSPVVGDPVMVDGKAWKTVSATLYDGDDGWLLWWVVLGERLPQFETKEEREF